MTSQSHLTFRNFSWYFLGVVLLVLGGIDVIFILSAPGIVARNQLLLFFIFYLLPVAVLVPAILLRPKVAGKKLLGLGVLLVSFLLYYVLIIGVASSSGYAFQTSLGPVTNVKEFQSTSVNSSQNIELFVSTFNGPINVFQSSNNSNQVTINATVKGIQAIVSSVSFNFADSIQKNGTHAISFSTTKPGNILTTILSSMFSSSLSIGIDVYVPANQNYSSISLQSTNGMISASSLYGSNLSVSTTYGAISLSKMNFTTISAYALNGGIRASIKAKIAMLSTINGEILLTTQGAGNYSAKTINGAIYATDIAGQIMPVKVQASTTNGAVSTTGQALITTESSPTSLSGYTPNFSPDSPYLNLVLETSNGDIVISLI